MESVNSRRPPFDEYSAPSYPTSVILEMTNQCNLRCRMCHVWGEDVTRSRETGFISEDVWKKAIDEMAGWNETVHLSLHGAGEALLHKDFLQVLTYATSHHNLAVGFLTNGSLLTKELSRAIMKTDISWVGFSVDGTEEDVYRKYRKSDLQRVESAIEYLVSLKKKEKPFIFVNMVALPDIDENKYVKRWVSLVDEVKVSTYRRSGRRDFLTQHIERVPCFMLNEMLVIAWNGVAALCCEDIWADVSLGRFPDQSLLDLWHSAPLEHARELHRNGRYSDISICAQCDSWSNQFTSTETRKTENLRMVRCAAQTSYQLISKQQQPE